MLANNTVLLNEIYRRYSGKIRWMVMKNNGTESEAADIFQEALLAIYQKAKTTNFTLTCPLDAFLYFVCKNKWLNELSKKKLARVTFQDTAVYNIGDGSFEQLNSYQLEETRRTFLTEKVDELGDSCKKLLRLNWEGKSLEEVAKILELTYGYVRKKKCECMEKLMTNIRKSAEFTALKW